MTMNQHVKTKISKGQTEQLCAGLRFTSSGVSLVSGWAWTARRARAPARMLLRLICRSGGGPPRGWPLTMTAQPDKTCEETNQCECTYNVSEIVYHSRHVNDDESNCIGSAWYKQSIRKSNTEHLRDLLIIIPLGPACLCLANSWTTITPTKQRQNQ